jgi:uncharacterized protein YjbI with pentapeptide repeats
VKAGSCTIWGVVITLLALVGGLIIYSYADWPGARYFGIADKNFWDYLELLIVPAALAFGVYWLNRTQDLRQQEADRFQQQLQLEHNQMQQDRGLEVVTQQAQDAALRAYLDQMSQLMLEQGLEYYAEPGIEGASANRLALARARTLTVLPTLGAHRKRSVLQFLYESGLINTNRTIVELTGADLSQADLRGLNLSRANLSEADLGRADLRGVVLSGADLRGAVLAEANLSEAHLSEANLHNANLHNANLHNANLRKADLGRAKLSEAILSEAYLDNANLHGAVLRKADLGWAELGGTDLGKANLSEANLSKTNLREADLCGAQVADHQLDDTQSLHVATMPNGQKYEDWLKDREGRKEDAEND